MASAVFAAGGCIAAAGQASADPCSDVQVIFARGTFEPPGVVQTTALSIEDGRIAAIYIVRNPEKTKHLAHLLERAADA